MAGVFDSQYLLKSLKELTESKNQVEDLSKWCQENVANAKEIVRMWNTEYISLPPEKRVAFLYLVNDILHRSIESNRVFVDEFAEVLPGAIDREMENLKKSEKIVPQMISIWRGKQLYGPEFLMGHIDDSGSRGEKRKRVSEEEEENYAVVLASNKAALQAELKTLMVESVDSSISNIQSQVTTLTAEVEQLRKKFKEAENVWRQLSG